MALKTDQSKVVGVHLNPNELYFYEKYMRRLGCSLPGTMRILAGMAIKQLEEDEGGHFEMDWVTKSYRPRKRIQKPSTLMEENTKLDAREERDRPERSKGKRKVAA